MSCFSDIDQNAFGAIIYLKLCNRVLNIIYHCLKSWFISFSFSGRGGGGGGGGGGGKSGVLRGLGDGGGGGARGIFDNFHVDIYDHHYYYQSLKGCWGTTVDFATTYDANTFNNIIQKLLTIML